MSAGGNEEFDVGGGTSDAAAEEEEEAQRQAQEDAESIADTRAARTGGVDMPTADIADETAGTSPTRTAPAQAGDADAIGGAGGAGGGGGQTPGGRARQGRAEAAGDIAEGGGTPDTSPSGRARADRGEAARDIAAEGGTPAVTPGVRARRERSQAAGDIAESGGTPSGPAGPAGGALASIDRQLSEAGRNIAAAAGGQDAVDAIKRLNRRGAGGTARDVVAETERATRPGEESDIEVDTDVTDRLTEGGILSDRRGGTEGVLPGEFTPTFEAVGGRRLEGPTINLSKRGFRQAGENIRNLSDVFRENEPIEVERPAGESVATTGRDVDSARIEGSELARTVAGQPGTDLPERVLQGGAEFGINLAATAVEAPATIDTAAEVTTNLPGTVDEFGRGEVAEEIGKVGLMAGQETVRAFRDEPIRKGAGTAAGIATGLTINRVVGRAGRVARDRVRTAGGTRVDLEDITSEEAARFVETDGAEGERFPSADDPDLYDTDPASAVTQQAGERTTADIEALFERRGFTEGATLKKALDVEPEGPKRGRAAQGFQSAPGESLEAFDYEVPGAFVGPDLSPNFLGVTGQRGFSLRPGLPDIGNKPTAALIRTDVDAPDADDLDAFKRELIDREGETIARTKPAKVGTPEEIEAVIPPGSEFRDIGGSLPRNVARRLGVGSDFYTVVRGRRVPLRPVVPDDSPDVDQPPRFGFDNRAEVELEDLFDGDGAAFRGRQLDDLLRGLDEPVDRPLPPLPSVPSDATDVSGVDLSDVESPPADLDSPSDVGGPSAGSGRGLPEDALRAGGSDATSGGGPSPGRRPPSPASPSSGGGSSPSGPGSTGRGGSGGGSISTGGGSGGGGGISTGGGSGGGSGGGGGGGGSGGGSGGGGGGGGGDVPFIVTESQPRRRPDIEFDADDEKRRFDDELGEFEREFEFVVEDLEEIEEIETDVGISDIEADGASK